MWACPDCLPYTSVLPSPPGMAEIAHVRELPIRDSVVSEAPRHSAVVRITHWIAALSLVGLVISGIAILLAHPRFYWGETGAVGTPSLFDLPLPFMLDGQSGWGRYLHFLSAWVCVLTGLFYLLSGLITQHFRKDLLPGKADLAWNNLSNIVWNHLRFKRPAEEESLRYNVLQRLAYLGVVFVLLPLMILTGLAMSPAVTSVFPEIVSVFGGQQSARTIHFFVANFLVLFLLVHIVMVFLAGFTRRVRAMITGRA
jgi:thiosulfate reductase cytochrome b subunit